MANDGRLWSRLGPELAERLAAYAGDDSLSVAARRLLAEYLELLDQELRTVAFTEAGASLIVDACNGVLFEPHTVRLLWAEVDDAVRLDHLDQKWGVDGQALVERLRQLCPGQAFTVVNAIRRFWSNPNPREERLREVGLVKEEG